MWIFQYPALIPGDGVVKGFLLRMKREGLKITDRIEGYHPSRDRCLYVREEVVVQFEAGEEAITWTYVFANPERVADYPRLVVGELNGVPLNAWTHLNS